MPFRIEHGLMEKRQILHFYELIYNVSRDIWEGIFEVVMRPQDCVITVYINRDSMFSEAIQTVQLLLYKLMQEARAK